MSSLLLTMTAALPHLPPARGFAAATGANVRREAHAVLQRGVAAVREPLEHVASTRRCGEVRRVARPSLAPLPRTTTIWKRDRGETRVDTRPASAKINSFHTTHWQESDVQLAIPGACNVVI